MYILAALLLDTLLGDPHYKFHPVIIVGQIIEYWENRLYSKELGRIRGIIFVFCVLFTVLMAVSTILFVAFLLGKYVLVAVEIFLLYSAIAFRSLRDESNLVATALQEGKIDKARMFLSYIVGRDTETLEEKAIVRATVETIAENYIDGIISVLIYMLLGSLFNQAVLFAWIFKAINTMDSMVGHENDRYSDFGWAAAKLDDVVNFIPARVGSLIAIIGGGLVGFDIKRGFAIFLRDRKKHKSPNSAHGESAFAGLLGITLGGGSFYHGEFTERPTLGDNTREPEISDIINAHKILTAAVVLSAFIILFSARFI